MRQRFLNKHPRLLIGLRFAIDSLAASILLHSLVGCAPLSGYAQDPASDSRLPAELKEGFGQGFKDQYAGATDPTAKRVIRDKIIYRQLTAYDLEFEKFERGLTGNNNLIALSTDMVVLGLAGAGAVVREATVTSALAAGTAFFTGSRTAIDKDLFYQSSLPALKAQMEAKRLEMRVPIVEGLGKSDADYPLQRALWDLGNLRAAGSLTAAITSTIQDAGVRADAAQVRIDLAPATAEYKQATAPRYSIDDRIRKLSLVQSLKMAQDMETILQQRPDAIRSRVLRYDPTNLRLKNGRAAQQALLVWRQDDLTDPASIKQWTDELDRIEQ